MKKLSFIISILLIACILVSCTLPIAYAVDNSSTVSEILQENEPEVTIETLKTPKLPTLDGLAEMDNCFSWNPGSNINGYHVRIVGIDRVTRKIFDKNYKAKADHPYLLLPELNEGEYLLLVKADSNNEDYLSSDWAVMEYRIGVEAPDGVWEDCHHNNWEGFYCIFESTEETEGLEVRYCLTCLKTQVIRNSALPSDDEWMIFTLINGGTEYSVRGHSVYTEKPYEEAIIPAYHNGKPVTQIENFGFYRMLNLKTVVIPNTVTKINDAAFGHCPNLQSINFDKGNAYYKFDAGCLIEIETNKIIAGTNESVIPSYITNIGLYAFYALKMTNVFIPASVKEIGDCAFGECIELKSVIFENGSKLEKISVGMFGGCINLKDIVLSYNIKSIDDNAFSGCSLTSITIPSSVTSIGFAAFAVCTNLTSITIGSGVTSIGSNAFESCISITSITIPSSVTIVGSYAFSSCTNLTSIIISDSVKSIGNSAFGYCTSLTSITIPSSVTSICLDSFYNCTSLTDITVEIANTAYKSIDGVLFNRAGTTLIQYPIGNTRTTYTIPSSVTSIGSQAFSDCTSLASITIPSSVTSIGLQAFYNCSSLTSITIPDSVTSIGTWAFNNCTSLTTVNVNSSSAGLTKYGYNMWYGCTSLLYIYVPDEASVTAYKRAINWSDYTTKIYLKP